jgi:UDP-glucose 4-epimerase
MILITGGMGFLGVNLAKCLLDLGEEVVLTRHRNPHVPDILASYLDKKLHITAIDITRLTTILDAIKQHKVTSIIHAASGGTTKGQLYQSIDVNVVGSANVLEAVRLMEVSWVTFISSEAVNQGRKDTTPLKEEEFFWVRSDRYTPADKKMAELLFFIYQKEYKLDMRVVRPSRIYGPFYAGVRNPILRMATAAVKGGQTIFKDVNESEGHDFVYARDCARAVAMVHLAKKPKHDIYNIGLGKLHSFGDVARILEKIIPGTSLELGSGEFTTVTKTEYDILTCLDITRISNEFGYIPEYDLEKGLSALIAWIRYGSYI